MFKFVISLLIVAVLVGCSDVEKRYYVYDGSFDQSDPAVELREPELRKTLDKFVLDGQLMDELIKMDELLPLRDRLRNSHFRKDGMTGYVLVPRLRVEYHDKAQGEALRKMQSHIGLRVADFLKPTLPPEVVLTQNTPVDTNWAVYFAPKLGVTEADLRRWYVFNDTENRTSVTSVELEQLRSGEIKMFDSTPFQLDDTLIAELKSAPNLVGLRIGRRDNARSFDWIGELPNLKVLDISKNDFSATGFPWLSKLKNLTSLWMNQCTLPNPVAGWLPLESQILEVWANDVVLTNDHLELLPEFQSLKRLSFRDTDISDEGFDEIPRVAPSLEFLWLIRNRTLTSKSVPVIGKLRGLRYVDVESSFIEETEYQREHGGIPALESLLPNCVFDYRIRRTTRVSQ